MRDRPLTRDMVAPSFARDRIISIGLKRLLTQRHNGAMEGTESKATEAHDMEVVGLHLSLELIQPLVQTRQSDHLPKRMPITQNKNSKFKREK